MFNVYFHYPEGPKDFLESFITRKEAEAYVASSVGLEGWDLDNPEATQYVIEEA
jgi:hypothetical protein